MASPFPFGTSKWRLIGGQWFPIIGSNVTPRFIYTNASQFKNGDRMIDGIKDGLSPEDFDALMAKFPQLVAPDGGEFTLPLVPEGTVVDLTPESPTDGTDRRPGAAQKLTKKKKKKRS